MIEPPCLQKHHFVDRIAALRVATELEVTDIPSKNQALVITFVENSWTHSFDTHMM